MSNQENNEIFRPLEKLIKKPNPVPYKKFVVPMPKERNEEDIENKEQILEENQEEISDENTDKQIKKLVVDKRKDNRIDRMAIMNKIKKNMKVEVFDKSDKPDNMLIELRENIPTNTGKQLLIEEEEKEEDLEQLKIINGDVEVQKEPIVEIKEDLVMAVKETEQKNKKPLRKRKLKIVPDAEDITNIDLTTAMIRTQKVVDRLPNDREKIIIKAPSYYMNNRKIYIQKLTELFRPYQKEILDNQENASCDQGAKVKEFNLLTHQKIVRDYLNLYTPYRGLLLYHGLGSGKTCTSIAIAEGMKSNKRVFVLTPASLKMNFFSEMKKCGDDIYKKNQFWEFVSIDGNPDYVGILAKSLSLSTNYIHERGGAWLVNINKESNYENLDSEEQKSLDDQLNEMIRAKYTDINYNGMNENKMKLLTGNYTNNPFDNSVVIIDEAHNFVSRVVNKLTKPKSISYRLYDYLMSASNAKIVFLTGTPIINYPNEIAVLYNMLRGYINSYVIPIKWEKKEKLNTDTILTIMDKENIKTFDSIEYSDGKLTITRNPFGFINTKKEEP